MIIAAASSSPVLSTATADQSRIARPKSSRIKSLIVSIATPLAYRGADCPPLLLSTQTITGFAPTPTITHFLCVAGREGATPYPSRLPLRLAVMVCEFLVYFLNDSVAYAEDTDPCESTDYRSDDVADVVPDNRPCEYRTHE